MPPKKSAGGKDDGLAAEERLTRIAIVSADRCRPKKCRHECKKSCPVVKIGAPRAHDTLLSAPRASRRRARLSAVRVCVRALPPRSASARQAVH
jgi:hypothetical protein